MVKTDRDCTGFRHKGEIVFALIYTLARGGWLIVWIDRDGNSTDEFNRPADPRKRMVNVGPGDSISHKGEPLKVTAVQVYRSLPEGAPAELLDD